MGLKRKERRVLTRVFGMLREGIGLSAGHCRMNGTLTRTEDRRTFHPEEVVALRHGSGKVHGGLFRTKSESHVAGPYPSRMNRLGRGVW